MFLPRRSATLKALERFAFGSVHSKEGSSGRRENFFGNSPHFYSVNAHLKRVFITITIVGYLSNVSAVCFHAVNLPVSDEHDTVANK
jgi:uncharacterized protein (DUF2235 family)